ncbi:hypothetical protein DPEC_G00306000 [Dallia pectoralis]|uniref:Uncharacterized protein n=1 Tax=Dallia pectoralis TaxID=75939 RepID=A0ACC2FE05_DALPE|nr:hypothetical protein DPEC_G00306000 [Dallia pectoralis]
MIDQCLSFVPQWGGAGPVGTYRLVSLPSWLPSKTGRAVRRRGLVYPQPQVGRIDRAACLLHRGLIYPSPTGTASNAALLGPAYFRMGVSLLFLSSRQRRFTPSLGTYALAAQSSRFSYGQRPGWITLVQGMYTHC